MINFFSRNETMFNSIHFGLHEENGDTTKGAEARELHIGGGFKCR